MKLVGLTAVALIMHGCPNGSTTGGNSLGTFSYNDAMRGASPETRAQLRQACGASRGSAECRNPIDAARVANNATVAPGARDEDTCHDCDNSMNTGRFSVISTPPADMDAKTEKAFEEYKRAGGDPMAFKQALCYLKKNQNSPKSTEFGNYQMNPCILSIQNNSKHENTFRRPNGGVAHTVSLIRVDLCEGKVDKGISALGYGGQCTEDDICPQGSGKTPHGFVMLGGKHETSKDWGPGIKMWGLEKFNKNNVQTVPGKGNKGLNRGVVFHRAKVAGEDSYYCGNVRGESGPACSGSTAGCTGTTRDMWDKYKHLMSARPSRGDVATGELHYNFSSYEKRKGENYCGSN